MSSDRDVDMDTPRTYFQPHPGKQGACMRIPEQVRLIAVDLVNKTVPLKDAVARLRATDVGKVWVVEEYKYIALNVKHRGVQHHFRVICYK